MAELLEPWTEAAEPDRWAALMQAPEGVLQLWVYKDRAGLWQALVEFRESSGAWPSKSPFASLPLAQKWAEARAEQIRNDW